MNGSRAEGRILLVDDDNTMLCTLTTLLQENGYDVETASSGMQTVNLISDQAFDLVLLDLNIANAAGAQTVPQLREKYSPAELP
ncbi:MAG: response regulator, partial [Planctomycetaceae bacterium]|nr:response regulator [Planctomycetaceae bacterium]